MFELTSVTIDNQTYEVEKIEVESIIPGGHYVFYGIYWYKVIGFNLHNHIKSGSNGKN